MSDSPAEEAEEAEDAVEHEPAPRRTGAVGVAAVVVVGVALGGLLALLLAGLGDDDGDASPRDDEVPVTLADRLPGALAAAGVPEPVASCAAATLADQPADVQAAVAAEPLGADGPGREVVTVCAIEHLAGVVESSAGIAGTDARCVAGDVVDRVGLEAVLVSIGALAVTADVAAAATAAAEACAAAP